MENFWVTVRKEIGEHLPADEVEHYAFTAGLNLSFLELTRYLRKRARARVVKQLERLERA